MVVEAGNSRNVLLLVTVLGNFVLAALVFAVFLGFVPPFFGMDEAIFVLGFDIGIGLLFLALGEMLSKFRANIWVHIVDSRASFGNKFWAFVTVLFMAAFFATMTSVLAFYIKANFLVLLALVFLSFLPFVAGKERKMAFVWAGTAAVWITILFTVSWGAQLLGAEGQFNGIIFPAWFVIKGILSVWVFLIKK